MVKVKGKLRGRKVAIRREEDGQVVGDPALIHEVAGAVRAGERLTIGQPYPSVKASIIEPLDFGVTAAALLDAGTVELEGMPAMEDDSAGSEVDY